MDAPQSEQRRWFAEEVQRHEPELREFLRRRFPTVHDVDDLVQAAYLSLLRARQTGAIMEPRAYLFATARNAALDLFRRKPMVSVEALAETQGLSVVDTTPDAAESASHAQEIDLLVAAIDSLPARCREIVVLRKLHGLSYREIAQQLGITENTVNAQLVVGLARCRRFLEAHGVNKRSGDAPTI